MSNRLLRNQRRAAARDARKLEQNRTEVTPEPAPVETTRAEINRANSLHSTGPRSTEGKSKSSQNSFKHGLYSNQLVLPGEDPAELDQLRASLRAEHQPANTTEEILVNELAENFWRLRRMRRLEARTLNAEDLDNLTTLLPAIQRTMASAERAFHKSLATLRRLQQDRGAVSQIGFVPQNNGKLDPAPQPTPSPERSDGSFVPPETGFVSQNGQSPHAEAA